MVDLSPFTGSRADTLRPLLDAAAANVGTALP
jgi:hypothetical protein